MTSGIRLPDVPQVVRPHGQESETLASKSQATPEAQFVPRTLRVIAVLVVTVVMVLAGTGRFSLIVPFLTGSALGMTLIAGLEIVVRRAFSADAVLGQRGVALPDTQKPSKKFAGKAAIGVFALIKYPAVAVLIYFVIRTGTTAQIAAFTGGFVLCQIIIGLRGLGAFLYPRAAPN